MATNEKNLRRSFDEMNDEMDIEVNNVIDNNRKKIKVMPNTQQIINKNNSNNNSNNNPNDKIIMLINNGKEDKESNEKIVLLVNKHKIAIKNTIKFKNTKPPNKRPIVPIKKPDNKPNNNPNKNNQIKLNEMLFLNLLFGGGLGRPGSIAIENKVPAKPTLECNNPLCNHLTLVEDATPPVLIDIEVFKTINDLIKLGKAFHCKKQTVYKGINLRLMNNLIVPLTELNDMIGLGNVKNHIVDQILFFLQGFNTSEKCNKCADCVYGLPCVQNRTEMLHTVITGPPGVGKTCLARIIGKVYKAMGILSNGEFHEVARSDLIAKYVGQTAIKTQEAIDKCTGGIMFIDEAYSLGHKEKRDSFAKECLDTLNKNLSEKRDFLCIIAGYKNELEECFFSMNDGLNRRFSFRYDVTEYDYNELLAIFKLKVKHENWSIDLNIESDKMDIVNSTEVLNNNSKYIDEDLINLFRKHREMFPYSGGDVETLFLKCKISHSRRVPTETTRKILSMNDIEEGIKIFIEDRKYNETKSKKNNRNPAMYTL